MFGNAHPCGAHFEGKVENERLDARFDDFGRQEGFVALYVDDDIGDTRAGYLGDTVSTGGMLGLLDRTFDGL